MTTDREVLIHAMRRERRRHKMAFAHVGCACGWKPSADGHKTNEFAEHIESSVLNVLLADPSLPSVWIESRAAFGVPVPPKEGEAT